MAKRKNEPKAVECWAVWNGYHYRAARTKLGAEEWVKIGNALGQLGEQVVKVRIFPIPTKRKEKAK